MRSRSSLLALLLCFLGCGSEENPPGTSGTALRVSKETTYVTTPLKPDGYIDYAEALNQSASDGVNVENNAAVLLAQSLGPDLFDKPFRRQFFAKLGIPVPPHEARYFLSLEKYAEQQAPQESRKYLDELYEQFAESGEKPWSRSDLPKLAAWLDINEQPLKLVLKATQRPSYYFPMLFQVGDDGEPILIAVLLSLPEESRSIARALSARTMLAVQEGRIEDAQADILACHRLARLISHGQTLIEGLVGVAIESMACSVGKNVLQSGRLSDAQLLEYERALGNLPALWSAANKINIAERFVALDSCTIIAKQGGDGMKALTVLAGPTAQPCLSGINFGDLDWNFVLKTINVEFDQLYVAASKVRYSDRRTALNSYEERIKDLRAGLQRKNPPTFGSFDRKQGSRVMADFLVSLLVPAISQSRSAQDRAETRLQLLRIAAALERFRRARGSFPNGLSEVKLADGRKAPVDLYTEKTLRYRLTKTGYLLYATGDNQKDDGGQTFDSKPPGDDIVVRMSLE